MVGKHVSRLTPGRLASILKLMREYGVTELRDGDLSLTMTPQASSEPIKLEGKGMDSIESILFAHEKMGV